MYKLILAMFACLSAVASAQLSIIETAIATPALSTLVTVLTLPDYKPVLDVLSGEGPFTVFAPTNDAFEAAGVDPSQVDVVTEVLKLHVLNGAISSSDLGATQVAETLMTNSEYVNLNGEGQRLQVNKIGNSVTVSWGPGQTAEVVIADVVCTNGIVHVVESVIFFSEGVVETAQAAGLNNLIAAVVKAGLAEPVTTTPGITIFAPTDAAFNAVDWESLPIDTLRAVLTYHVVPAYAGSNQLSNGMSLPTLNGGSLRVDLSNGVKINDATVVAPNFPTTNAVVHVIDSVMLPAGMDLNNLQKKPSDLTIVETALTVPALSTLVAVLTTPGYEPVLNALNDPNGDFTVFAPTNDAFEAAGVDPSDVALVTQVLNYHVLRGSVFSGDLGPTQFVPTLMNDPRFATLDGEGQRIQVSRSGNAVTINWGLGNEATVVIADVECSNGVVHVIDTVITPFPALTSATAVAAGLSELVNAVVATNLVGAIDETPKITIFAPTNEALIRAGAGDLTTEQLINVLTYHVVPAYAFSTDLTDGMELGTLNGETLKVNLANGVRIETSNGGANVAVANVITQNAVVHVIDDVLLPREIIAEMKGFVLAKRDPTKTIVENAVATPSLSTLVAVLTSPGYEPVLNALNSNGTYTVFAPNDAAFARAGVDPRDVELVTQVLFHHTLGAVVRSGDLAPAQFVSTLMTDSRYVSLGGEGQRIGVFSDSEGVTVDWGLGRAQVVTADVECSNGVVHIIDEVIMLPPLTSETAVAAGLSTLVEQVVKAGLVAAVDETEKITIFAPTNEAFAAIPGLGDLTVDQLTAILTYHVVPAYAYSTDLSNGALPTLNGNTVDVTLANGGVTLNGNVNVVIANVMTKNAVVHVIDKVLLPPTFQL